MGGKMHARIRLNPAKVEVQVEVKIDNIKECKILKINDQQL